MNLLRPEGLILLTLLLGLGACRPEPLPVVWENLSTGVDETLFRMAFDPLGGIWVAGGKTWHHGSVYYLPPNETLLQPRLRTEKALLGLDLSEDGSLAVTGVDGHIHVLTAGGDWQDQHPQRWATARSVHILPGGRLVIAGGNAFESGYMLFLDAEVPAEGHFDHLNRINDLVCPEPNTLLAAGYGIMYRSSNQGLSWEVLDVSGDHFMQLSFPSATTGFAVGYGGSILKTTDGGQTWGSLRNGRRLDTRGQPFRAVFFRDELTGAVVGDKGLVWLTTDGGKKWQRVAGLPARTDLHCVLMHGDTLFVGGDNGQCFRASLP